MTVYYKNEWNFYRNETWMSVHSKSHFLFIFSLFRAWLILLHSTMNKNDIIIISSDEEEKELDSQQQTSQPCIWLILNYDLSIYLF